MARRAGDGDLSAAAGRAASPRHHPRGMTRLSLIRTARTGVNHFKTVCLKGRNRMYLIFQHGSTKFACNFKGISGFRSAPCDISVGFIDDVAAMQPADLAWRS